MHYCANGKHNPNCTLIPKKSVFLKTHTLDHAVKNNNRDASVHLSTAQALESKFDDLKTRLEDKSESMMKEVERLDRDQGKIGLLLEQLQHQLNVEQCALSTRVQDIDKTLDGGDSL